MYKSNCSVDDAVSLTLHTVLKFLDLRVPNYVRLLFVDCSSAFNTISPIRLYEKLKALTIDPYICEWSLDFLLNGSQFVKIGTNFSKTIAINTGAPQGYLISPLLYSLFTHDCVSAFKSCSVIKYANDTTIARLIGQSESEYRNQISLLVKWCTDNNLELNVMKTK